MPPPVDPTETPPSPEGFIPLPFGPHGTFLAINGPLSGKREGNRLVLGFRVERRHVNPIGICHGGMLMTFADMVLAIGSIFETKLGRFLPTVNLTGDFLAPAPFGSWVEGRTQVLRTTRNLIFAQALVEADGVPVLRTSGILKIGPEMKDRLDLHALLP
jgi:uncharacterized protein (TIGR00369 family)